jgi:spermidine/putrescine transport system substrate-binding protein
VLYDGHYIRAINASHFESSISDQFSWLNELEKWTRADDGNLIGISQRFGPFNMVVNTNRISSTSAGDLGFNIVEEVAGDRPYGILQFPEFNIFHICIAAAINPFAQLSRDQLDRFEQMAVYWFSHATLVSDDSKKLNQGLIDGTIDFFVSGGLFTSAAARLAGQSQIKCVTPSRGPIDGRGAIAFMEITSLPSASKNQELGIRYLDYLLESDVVLEIAMNPEVCNPVSQMANPSLFDRLPKNYLEAIQWDTLEEDIARCAAYDIPPNFSDLSFRLEKAQNR